MSCLGFHGDNPYHHYDLVTEKYRCVVEESFSTPPSTWTPQGWRGQPGKVKVSLWGFCQNPLSTAVMWSMSSFHLHFYFLDVAIFPVFTFLNQMWLFSCIHFSFWDVATFVVFTLTFLIQIWLLFFYSLSLFFFRCGYFSFFHSNFPYSDVAIFLLFTFTFLF